MASELVKDGRLSSLPQNPSCSSWNIPSAYYEEDKAVIANAQKSNREKAAKDIDQQIDMVVALYTDRETVLKQDYNRIKSRRGNDFISGQITEGQHNYFTDADRINHLKRMIDNKQQMISAMYVEINKRIDVNALYAKYNMPVDTGAATLRATSEQISDPVEKSALNALSNAKSK